MLRLSLLRVCAYSARPMVVLCSRYFVACPPKVVLPALLFPLFLVSTLPHAFKVRNQIVEARCDYFLFAAYNNLRRQVQSRQLNSSELDVTPMCKCYFNDVSGSSGAKSRQHGAQSTLQNPLYNMHSTGDERSLAGRVSCSKLTFKVRNVQPPSYEPGPPLLILQETQITVQSLQNTTSPANCVPRLSQ